jgi:prevent-host-death family protein
MGKPINIHAAKTHFSRLVERAARGEEIIIARAGRPVARLVALGSATRRRRPGLLKGRIRIGKDFDAQLPEKVLRLFERR